ncbi:hypothetical protein ES703_104862 [subsurface metagenome]
MPKILIPEHHTIADWDFRHGALYRSLSATRYISEPTSLKFLNATGSYIWDTVLCRLDSTLCLPQGEVRTWLYPSADWAHHPFSFRNQAALGSSNNSNHYFIELSFNVAYLICAVAGDWTIKGSVAVSYSLTEWNRWRIVWYNGETPGEVPALCVDLYKEVAGEWVKQGSTMYDTANRWKDSAVNRCGIEGDSVNNHPEYWDDTEIWGPV